MLVCLEHFFRRKALALVPPETRQDALDWVWRAALEGEEERGEVTWSRLCVAIVRYFERRVPGARERPFETRDLDLFALDATLWQQEDGPLVSQAESNVVPISELLPSRRKLGTFWR